MTAEQFKKWLQNKEGKKETTALQYASAIIKLSDHYSQHKGVGIDIYNISDVALLEQITLLYGLKGKYSEFGNIGHGTYRAAINAFLRYKASPNMLYNSNNMQPFNQNTETIKIGTLVKNHIKKIFQYCETQDRDELFRLMDKEYSKRVFNINYPFCKELSLLTELEFARYWKSDYEVRNKTIRVCSQWVITSKDLFLDYLLFKGMITQEDFSNYQKIVQYIPPKKKIKVSLNIPEAQIESDYRNNGIPKTMTPSEKFQPQFDAAIKAEAKEMSKHYEILYSLEKTMRNIVLEVMANKYGFDWWENKVSIEIKKKVNYNRQIELNTGHTQLSENEIDYTTFGDLRQIIESNWNDFSLKFKNKYAFNRIMYTLNQLRGPIAHSNYLNEDEVIRLNLTLKDWFRLVEE